MRQPCLVTVLMICTLTVSLQAQRAGGISAGHNAGVAFHSGLVGQRPHTGFAPGTRSFIGSGFLPQSRFFPRHFHSHGKGFGAVIVPYLYPYQDTSLGDDLYFQTPERASVVPAPQIIYVPREGEQLQTAERPTPPKLIEIASTANAKPKALPPTIFVLKNGRQIEARRFVLTTNSLIVDVGRQQQTISMDLLDVDATVSANRNRGIDLRVPADKNEISLSF